MRRWSRLGVIALLWISCSAGSLADDNPLAPDLAGIEQRYGREALARIQGWLALIESLRGQAVSGQLHAVNDFFNRLSFRDDQALWAARDYWATPYEMLAVQGGDCEDFAIAKYFTLKALGIPESRLKLVYVKALHLNQAHMVLTYARDVRAEPSVLDNLTAEIKNASQRTDLYPIYSFNGEGLWLARVRGQGTRVGQATRLKRWAETLARMSEQTQPLDALANVGAPP
jgi:predicted transglutaminase-like cysteine proteinase